MQNPAQALGAPAFLLSRPSVAQVRPAALPGARTWDPSRLAPGHVTSRGLWAPRQLEVEASPLPAAAAPHSASRYSPRAGAPRDPGEEDAEMEGRTEAAKTLRAHNHLRQTAARRDTSPRALPLSARVISGCLEGVGLRLAPPGDRLPRPVGPCPNSPLCRCKDVPDLEEPQQRPSPASSSCTSSFVRLKAGLLKTSFLWVFHWVKNTGEGALFLKCHP